MPDSQTSGDLKRRFSKIKTTSLSTFCYRAVSQKHDVLDTDGSLQYSGRYSTKRFRILHTTNSKENCQAERERKTKIKTKSVYKLAKLKVKVRKIIDLTNREILKTLNLQKSDLTSDNWNLTQRIATLAYQKGYEGFIAPSAAGQGYNILLFPGNFTKSSTVETIREEKLS